jgi:hypothetical protein
MVQKDQFYGKDTGIVKQTSEIPNQISIKDSFKGINDYAMIRLEMKRLLASLLNQKKIDLIDNETNSWTKYTERTRSYDLFRWLIRTKM